MERNEAAVLYQQPLELPDENDDEENDMETEIIQENEEEDDQEDECEEYGSQNEDEADSEDQDECEEIIKNEDTELESFVDFVDSKARARTAPLKPMDDPEVYPEIFKISPNFSNLE